MRVGFWENKKILMNASNRQVFSQFELFQTLTIVSIYGAITNTKKMFPIL